MSERSTITKVTRQIERMGIWWCEFTWKNASAVAIFQFLIGRGGSEAYMREEL